MATPEQLRVLRLAEDVVLLGAAVLLVVWVFGGRSPGWHPALYVAVVLASAIFVRRLMGWMRAK